jgi:hypothetical protein
VKIKRSQVCSLALEKMSKIYRYVAVPTFPKSRQCWILILRCSSLTDVAAADAVVAFEDAVAVAVAWQCWVDVKVQQLMCWVCRKSQAVEEKK